MNASSSSLDRDRGETILDRLQRIPMSPWHVRARLVVGIATFFDAFDLLALSFALPVLAERWALSSQTIGWIISSAFVGQIVGAFAFGWLAERRGRLYTVNVTLIVFGVASLACAVAPGPLWLAAFRFVQGVGLGGEVPVATTYVTELAQAKSRGRFYILFELVFSCGLLMAALAGTILVPAFGWQSLFVVGALPTLLAFFLRRTLPESPRWLVASGRLDEAERAVSLIETRVKASGRSLNAVPPPAISGTPETARLRDILRPPLRRRTLTVWALWFCCFSTGYGLITWAPTLYRSVFHLSVQQALWYSTLINICGLVGSTLCAFLIDRTGRRLWFTMSLALGAGCFATGWLMPPSSALGLVFISCSSYFFISSASISLNLYTPELYPTAIRALASSIGGSWQRVAAAISPVVIGTLLPSHGLASIFLYFSVLAALGGVVAGLSAYETANRPLDR